MSLSINHSYITKKIILQIEQSDKWEAWPELTLNIKNGVIPDISVYKIGEIKPNFFFDSAKCDKLPVLAIELLSPSQGVQELMEKAEDFLNAGIPAVWVVESYAKTIIVLTKENKRTVHCDVVETEGVQVDFSAIFNLN
ncbi:putative restriction endonuclease domain-containing protein [Candidatus Magnetomoraceae bacterium gMMP-15]